MLGNGTLLRALPTATLNFRRATTTSTSTSTMMNYCRQCHLLAKQTTQTMCSTSGGGGVLSMMYSKKATVSMATVNRGATSRDISFALSTSTIMRPFSAAATNPTSTSTSSPLLQQKHKLRHLYPPTTTPTMYTSPSINIISSCNNNNNSNIGSSIASFSSNNFTPPPKPPLPPPPPPKRSLGSMVSMAGTGALLLFGKTKYVLVALKLTKLAPLASMVITVGTYSMFFGLPYAAGMVGLILIHEIGHAAVMHARGMPFSPMVFIPFMGAVIATKELPRDAWEDALIAFGGPILGSVGAGAVGVMGHTLDSQLLIALADFGLMINLFNLLPLGQMDGGRIAGALSPYMSVAGVAMGTGLAYNGVIQNPVFYLIVLSGGYQIKSNLSTILQSDRSQRAVPRWLGTRRIGLYVSIGNGYQWTVQKITRSITT